MSVDPDRIAVPTNGRRPHAAPDASPPPPGAWFGGLSEGEMPVAFSPRQVAIGFGIVASLLLLLAGRARRRRSGD
jgi:hypothetical protein